MAERIIYRVVPAADGWHVTVAGSVLEKFATKEMAVQDAVKRAQADEAAGRLAQVVIH
jgi:Uncharacterized protein conserved in bacteria (DUF2188)